MTHVPKMAAAASLYKSGRSYRQRPQGLVGHIGVVPAQEIVHECGPEIVAYPCASRPDGTVAMCTKTEIVCRPVVKPKTGPPIFGPKKGLKEVLAL
jgi:hypothetical protein